jgi:AbrB family looped-hinge helix DNA binding protein
VNVEPEFGETEVSSLRPLGWIAPVKLGARHCGMAMVLSNGMKDVLIPIDQAGRIVLPKSVRDELAIQPGDTLKVSVHGSSVTLTPSAERAGFIRKGKALVFAPTGESKLTEASVEATLAAVRGEREARIFSSFPAGKQAR